MKFFEDEYRKKKPDFKFTTFFDIEYLKDKVTIAQWETICNISTVGCSMFNKCFNLLAYADDLVLLAPSWCSLPFLIINLLVAEADAVGLSVNTKKTVTKIFNPYDKRKCIRTNFPQFSLHGILTSVTSLKYFGHITDDALHDDNDINRGGAQMELNFSFLKPFACVLG